MLTGEHISYILGVAGLIGVTFTIYNSYRNPQVKTDQTTLLLREDLESLKDIVDEIKEKHLTSVEDNIKSLSKTIQELSLTVNTLGTIINERIPRLIK